MPYSGPNSPLASPRPRNHRRSHSSNTFFSDEKGPGAFVSLGALPKLPRKVAQKKSPTFHFRDDDDDDDDSPEDDPLQRFARLSIDTKNISSNGRSSPPGEAAAVPFPRCSSMSPVSESTPPLTASSPVRRPPLSRGASHPILLSNGKPLKSSLKSSPSSTSIPADARSLHLRVQSAPSTPFLSKNVHFPEKKEGGLENVRVFNRKAKPASLSAGGDDTETETEVEPGRFPFPKFGAVSSGPLPSPVAFEIDNETPGATSPVPAADRPASANVHFESLGLSHQSSSSPLASSAPHLTGTILVRNVAYEKSVAVRFTLDDWQTTSEVRARYVSSLLALPWETTQGRTLGDAVGIIANASNAGSIPSTWDRFSFTIRLEDHAYKLHERVLWFVGRYTCTGEGCGEWWDNNSGANFRVGFKVTSSTSREDTGRTVSAPEPMIKPATVEPAQRQGFGLGFEFPTLMSEPSSNGHTAPKTSSPCYSPPTSPSIRMIPPPPSPRTAQRISKLNLLNYAAPSIPSSGPHPSRSPLNSPLVSTNSPNSSTVPEVRATPPESPKDEFGHSTSPSSLSGRSSTTPRAAGIPQMIIGGQPATSSFMENQMQGIALQWPWGFGSSTRSGLISPLGSPPGSGSNSPRRYSPHNLSPLSSSSPSPQSRSGTTSPKQGVEAADSEQLYNEFVKQWCFAQSPGPGPGQNGFPNIDLADGVLVV